MIDRAGRSGTRINLLLFFLFRAIRWAGHGHCSAGRACAGAGSLVRACFLSTAGRNGRTFLPFGGPRSPSPLGPFGYGGFRRRDRFTLATASAAPPMPQSTGRQQDGGASWLMSAAKVYVYIDTNVNGESRVSGRRLCVGSSVRRSGEASGRSVRLDRDRSSACFGIAGWAICSLD